jgi:hypothetical protein
VIPVTPVAKPLVAAGVDPATRWRLPNLMIGNTPPMGPRCSRGHRPSVDAVPRDAAALPLLVTLALITLFPVSTWVPRLAVGG